MRSNTQTTQDHDSAYTGTIIFHLVHGTWAEDASWTKQGSMFRSHLENQLRNNHSRTESIEFTALPWGGKNLQSARVAGAKRLGAAVREKADSGVRQVLVGHSHGGNICLLACKDPSVLESVHGIVCLATPFLHFSKAPDAREVLWQFLIAWSAALLLAGFYFLGWHLKAFLFCFPVLVSLIAFWTWVERRGYNDPNIHTIPDSLPFPVLLMRCPGDEASGILGVSLVGEWIISRLSKFVGWFWREYAIYSALAALMAGLMFASGNYPQPDLLRSAYEAKDWVTVIIFFLFMSFVMILPILIVGVCIPTLFLFPIRFCFNWLYGLDVAMRGSFLTVTAEPAPPGVWQIHTIVAQPLARMAHSELYGNEEAIEAIAKWTNTAIKGKRVQ